MNGQIHAQLRPAAGVIRVWVGVGGKSEEFTLAEAAAICRAGDRALMDNWGDREGLCALDLADDASGRTDAEIAIMTVRRDWLVALLAALRRMLRGVAMAQACSAQVAAGEQVAA